MLMVRAQVYHTDSEHLGRPIVAPGMLAVSLHASAASVVVCLASYVRRRHTRPPPGVDWTRSGHVASLTGAFALVRVCCARARWTLRLRAWPSATTSTLRVSLASIAAPAMSVGCRSPGGDGSSHIVGKVGGGGSRFTWRKVATSPCWPVGRTMAGTCRTVRGVEQCGGTGGMRIGRAQSALSACCGHPGTCHVREPWQGVRRCNLIRLSARLLYWCLRYRRTGR